MNTIKRKRTRNPRLQRLSVDLPVEMHNKLKEIAAKKNATITQLIFELVESAIDYERQFE